MFFRTDRVQILSHSVWTDTGDTSFDDDEDARRHRAAGATGAQGPDTFQVQVYDGTAYSTAQELTVVARRDLADREGEVEALEASLFAALGDAGDTLTPELIWQLYQVEIDFVDTQQGRVIVPHRGGSL